MSFEQENEKATNKKTGKGTGFIYAGFGLGAYATGALALTGAVCPLCVVAAPALLATGVFKNLNTDKPIQQEI